MNPALIHVDFSYGPLRVLEDVSLVFPEKGVVCLSGPSGCGKTTLLRLLAGLERPEHGQIRGISDRKTAAVFQEDRLLPWMTALDNVALALPGGLRSNRDRAAEALALVGLAEQGSVFPSDLSGGMKRRVAIARALALDADMWLLDEPFTGIDPELRDRIASLLRQRAERALLVLVTHIEEEARLLGARTLPLSPPLRGEWHFPENISI